MRAVACLLIFAAAGCAHPPVTPPVELLVSRGENGCRLSAEGRGLAEGALAEAALGWRGRRVWVLTENNAPYKCVGFAVYTVQKAGVKDVRFVAQPLPATRDGRPPKLPNRAGAPT